MSKLRFPYLNSRLAIPFVYDNHKTLGRIGIVEDAVLPRRLSFTMKDQPIVPRNLQMNVGDQVRRLVYHLNSRHTHPARLNIVDKYAFDVLDRQLLDLQMYCMLDELALDHKIESLDQEGLLNYYGEISLKMLMSNKPIDMQRFALDNTFLDIWYMLTRPLVHILCNEAGSSLPIVHSEITPSLDVTPKYLVNSTTELISIIRLQCKHWALAPYFLGGLDTYALGELDLYILGLLEHPAASLISMYSDPTPAFSQLTPPLKTQVFFNEHGIIKPHNDITMAPKPISNYMASMFNPHSVTLAELDNVVLGDVDRRKLWMRKYGAIPANVTVEVG